MVPLPGVAGIYKALSKREVVDVASLAVDEEKFDSNNALLYARGIFIYRTLVDLR